MTVTTTAHGVRPTAAQVKYLADLVKQYNDLAEGNSFFIEDGPTEEVINGMIERGTLDKVSCSVFIDSLKSIINEERAKKRAQERQTETPWPNVPAGRYAVEIDDTIKFYQVDRPTEGRWAGYVFLNVQASDERYPIRNRETKQTIMDKIAADPSAAMERYGHEIGRCGKCGRTLTDEESIRRGIGPVCLENLGW